MALSRSPPHPSTPGGFQKSKDYRPRERAPQNWKRSNLRQIPAARADHAARVLLSDMSIWEDLSSEDHNLLCDLVPPHGLLFAWLDHQHHEHGPQAWGALREGLRGQEFEDLALRVMASAFSPEVDENGHPSQDAPTLDALTREAQMELRGMLNRMLIESLKAQETQAIEAAKDDPSALTRYRGLQTRRRQLELVQLSQQEN